MSALLKHTQTTDIEDREKIIMTGVLSLKAKKIRDIMTNLIDVFMLEANRIVDDELVLNVHGYGYSRIPVYEGRRFVFFLEKSNKLSFFVEIISLVL
jgi:CBS domain containing-hemolysin-like protein